MTTEEIDQKLRDLLDREFLTRLTEIGRLYGWCGDYYEIAEFISDLWYHAEMHPPEDMEPYEKDDE